MDGPKYTLIPLGPENPFNNAIYSKPPTVVDGEIQKIKFLDIRRISPTDHLRVLRNPTPERDFGGYFSPGLHNVPDVYVRHLERIYETHSGLMEESRYVWNRCSVDKQLALNRWYKKMRHGHAGEFFAPENNRNWRSVFEVRRRQKEECEIELGELVEVAMRYENAVNRDGTLSHLGWEPEAWRDIQEQIQQEERAKYTNRMERSTSVSTIASSTYMSVFDSDKDDEDYEFDHLYAFEDPPVVKDSCAKEETSMDVTDFFIEFTSDLNSTINAQPSGKDDETPEGESEEKPKEKIKKEREEERELEQVKKDIPLQYLSYGETVGINEAVQQNLSPGQYRKRCFLTALKKAREDVLNGMWSM